MAHRRALATAIFLVLAASFAAGCGDVPPAAAKKPAKKRTPPAVSSAPKVEPVAFDSVGEALAEFARIDKETDASQRRKLVAIQNWLVAQGDKIAPDLVAQLKDPEAELTLRMTACRVLAQLGPNSAPPLLEATTFEPRILRVKAIESLGRIKPSSRAIVARLLALLDAEDFEERKAALRALASVGPPAKEAVPKLTAMLNNVDEDETIRGLAKVALKSVDPRKGLMDVK